MELLHIIAIVTLQGFIDAKRCYFLTKTYKDIKYDWYNSKIIFQYKSMISSVNCEDGNICCRTTGRTCCSDPSVSKDEDIFFSTEFTLGTAFGVCILVSVCVTCCIVYSRRRKNQRRNTAVRVVQPAVACSSQNGTVIVRTPFEDKYQLSSQLHGASGTQGSFQHGTPEDVISSGEGARLSQTADLPPSYDDVMSQTYLITSDGKNHMRKREYSCVCCKKRTNQRDRRRVTAAQRLVLQKWTVGDVYEDEVLCSLCRVKMHSHLKQKKSEKQNLEHELRDPPFTPPERKQINARNAAIHSPPSVTLTAPSTTSSHSSCFICRKPGPKLVVVSSNERHSVYLRLGVLIPSGSRCCTRHLPNGRFSEEALAKISAFSETSTLKESRGRMFQTYDFL